MPKWTHQNAREAGRQVQKTRLGVALVWRSSTNQIGRVFGRKWIRLSSFSCCVRQKMKYSTLTGSFGFDGINEFLRDLSYGKGRTSPVKGAKIPKIYDIDAWDGKDGEMPMEEEIERLESIERLERLRLEQFYSFWNNFIPFGTILFLLEQFYSFRNNFIPFGTILFFFD